MASLTKRELVDLLKQAGCKFDSDRGKHEKWKRPDGNSFPVPRNLKGEGTLRNILKFVGIPHPKAK
jgi:predicted RNA binding protein YcfA (HicA-like mRNA interferase family)